jgi:AbrB family looped-hinge helix DNA binding protein
MRAEVTKIGKRGTLVIPAALRQQLGFHEGDLVIAEDCNGGILIRPAIALPIEQYTAERQAEFLLSNAIDAEDYKRAKEEVRAMGLDPDTIPHYKPSNNK